MQTIKVFAFLALFVAMIPGNGNAQVHPTIPLSTMVGSSTPDQQSRDAGNAVNTFGLKLLREVTAQRHQENTFLSPLSIFTALTMAESGAAGKTRDAMRQAMAVPAELSDDALHQSASAMLKSLRAQKGVELAIANALWSDLSTTLAANFVKQCHELYDAEATSLDFSQPSAADTINRWVSDNTRGKIPSIVDPTTVQASKAILTNAVYFKGKWEEPFPKDETRPGPFHMANGKEKQVPLMHLSSIKGGYRNGDGFEAAALGYEGSPTIRFYALLPAPGRTPEDILAKIKVETLRIPTERVDFDLRLPKFTLDYEAKLRDALTRMGMSIAFENSADFSPMGSPPVKIGQVLHKTRLEVDEEGTVAAAATAVVMAPTAVMRPEPKKVLVFDRPFAILLCDTETGTILFAGVVYDPK